MESMENVPKRHGSQTLLVRSATTQRAFHLNLLLSALKWSRCVQVISVSVGSSIALCCRRRINERKIIEWQIYMERHRVSRQALAA